MSGSKLAAERQALTIPEFCARQNEVRVDGVDVAAFIPWRSDCASLCATDPSCTTVGTCMPDNPWGAPCSVYAQRAGWCPGDQVATNLIDASAALTPGSHTIDFRIGGVPTGAYWLVSLDLALYGP